MNPALTLDPLTGVKVLLLTFTLWLFNIAMENDPFIDGLPIKNSGYFHGYGSHNQRVYWES